MLGDEHIIAPAVHRERRPAYDMSEFTACRAMDDANDAARARLESIALDSSAPIKLPRWAWDYWRRILGGYDTTLPTGTRIGKRWCREECTRTPGGTFSPTGRYFIGEYGVSSKGDGFVSITWYPVEVDEKDK